MAVAANKRSVMTLFSHADNMYSHQTRIVLAEKGVGVDIHLVNLANLPEDFFKSTDDVMAEYGKVAAWAISMNNHYLPNALNEFLAADEADAFLVAYSLTDDENRIIVTHEVSQPNRKNRIKIPEACAPFNVRYLNTIEMLREIGETF